MPYEVVTRFERALCKYTGARFACAVNSCTAALLLAVAWHLKNPPYISPYLSQHNWTDRVGIEIPKRTYVSVPMSIIHAGGRPTFRDEDWIGAYQLQPLPVWDCARRFTSGMYIAGQFQCVSFAASKILGIEQGGAILHDDAKAQEWFQAMKFDGRKPGTMPAPDTIIGIGHHCLMTPSVAAQGLLRLHHLPRHNEDLPHFLYPDLSTFPVFK